MLTFPIMRREVFLASHSRPPVTSMYRSMMLRALGRAAGAGACVVGAWEAAWRAAAGTARETPTTDTIAIAPRTVMGKVYTGTMLKGSREVIVRKIQPVSIHGQISLDVYYVEPDAPEQVRVARVAQESVPRSLEAGDRARVHFLLGVATEVTKA